MSLGSLSFCLLAALLLLDASAFQARRPATLLAAYPLQSGSGRAHAAVLGLVGRAEQETHLVWYSGCADLRVHDHAGLLAAAASGARTIPVFVLDDAVHCHLPEPVLRRLHSALVGLDCDLERNYGGHIVFKEGCAERALVELARETKATVVHLAADEPTFLLAAKLRKATTALEKAGVELRLWGCSALRPDAPWSPAGAALTNLPETYAEYMIEARKLPSAQPKPAPATLNMGKDADASLKTRRVPSCGHLLERADALARNAAIARAAFPTTEPFDHVVGSWCTTASARVALAEYLDVGRADFADRHLFEALPFGLTEDAVSELAGGGRDKSKVPVGVGGRGEAGAGMEAEQEFAELRKPLRVMEEDPLSSGMPIPLGMPKSLGLKSVEEVDRLVPLSDMNAADLWPAGESVTAAAASQATTAAKAEKMLEENVLEQDRAALAEAEEAERAEMLRNAEEIFLALSPPSLHAAAAQWVIPHVPRGGTPGARVGAAERPRRGAVGARLALREVATRAFSPALSLGALSAREVAAATVAAAGKVSFVRGTLSGQAWGRSEMGAVIDLLEWREWHRLLARKDLEAQRALAKKENLPAPSAELTAESSRPPDAMAVAGAAVASGLGLGLGIVLTAAERATAQAAAVKAAELAAEMARETPAYGYWRWAGQHLVRFAVWPSDADLSALADKSDAAWQKLGGRPADPLLHPDVLLDALVDEKESKPNTNPVLLFVHGFGASSEQWCRLARQMRLQMRAAGLKVPRMYAVDLLGFGHSEKPGLSYTQHLWEAMLVDFTLEVAGAHPFVAVGNSIGGGIAAGLASNLKSLCKGLVLCNTAGQLDEPEEYAAKFAKSKRTVGASTLRVRDHPASLGELYAPPPVGGQPLLDAFGYVLISWLLPQVSKLLRTYYPTQPEAVDEQLIASIVRDGTDPGAPNVIASGQKLPPQRPLNEVLSPEHGFGGPVLVPQGALDPLSGAKRSQDRAKSLAVLRPGVTVKLLDAGHCPHDEVPRQVAEEMVSWWASID